MTKFKITVLKRMANQDLVEEYCAPGVAAPCPHFSEGQEFIAEPGKQPEGFCPWAWDDLNETCEILRMGGNFAGWSKDVNSLVRCCTDGIRPVAFLVEKIDAE